MSDALDRVLDVLDVGLQVPPEVVGQGVSTDPDDDLCVRCRWQDREQGELCGGCRAWLLGDSDVDPIDVDMGGSPVPEDGPVRHHEVTVHVPPDVADAIREGSWSIRLDGVPFTYGGVPL